jgi:hypothetical protein
MPFPLAKAFRPALFMACLLPPLPPFAFFIYPAGYGMGKVFWPPSPRISGNLGQISKNGRLQKIADRINHLIMAACLILGKIFFWASLRHPIRSRPLN